MSFTLVQARDGYDWPALLTLIQQSFAYMEGRIDPPSSMLKLTAADIAEQARNGEVWVIEDKGRPVACVFLTPRVDALYIGKLTVARHLRGHGLARQLMQLAEDRAHALALPALELQSRIELIENHAAFSAMGFTQKGETSHPGFTRPTSLTFRKPV